MLQAFSCPPALAFTTDKARITGIFFGVRSKSRGSDQIFTSVRAVSPRLISARASILNQNQFPNSAPFYFLHLPEWEALPKRYWEPQMTESMYFRDGKRNGKRQHGAWGSQILHFFAVGVLAQPHPTEPTAEPLSISRSPSIGSLSLRKVSTPPSRKGTRNALRRRNTWRAA